MWIIYLGIYLGCSFLSHYVLIYHMGGAHFKWESNPRLRQKYPCFVRNDMEAWTWTNAMLNILQAPFRFTLGMTSFISAIVTSCILKIGSNMENPSKMRKFVYNINGRFWARLTLLVQNCFYIKTEYMHDADYSKWLGPDYKPQWTGCGTIISNHVSSFNDILLCCYLFWPSFVTKKSVKKWHFVGTIA